jgi:CheY-like chemotaxis protein
MAKIMLVEDDNNLREIYEARLMAEGYEIVTARDGEEALAVAVKEKPDLIISDVMMPKISGFDMLDILRSTPETKNAKVIMMTALSQAEDKERANKLGADRYLVKSQVTLEDVAKVAREVLEAPAAKPAAAEPAPAPTPAAPAPAVTAPEPVAAPAPVSVPEPAAPAAPEPVAAAPASVPAPAVTVPEPTPAAPAPAVTAPEPVAAPAPVSVPEPAAPAAPEPVAVPEPVATPEPMTAPDATESDIDVSSLAASTVATASPMGITNLSEPASTPAVAAPAVEPEVEIEKPSAEVWSAEALDTPAPAPAEPTPALAAAEAKVDASPMQSIEDEEAAIAKQIESAMSTVVAPAPAEPATAPTATQIPVTVAEEAPAAPAAPAAQPEAAPEPPTAPAAPPKAAGQKVIQPLSDSPEQAKPSLEELAKKEEEKEQAQQAGGVVHPESSSTSGIDPNSLAL